jgi:hypothetical protein
LVVLGEATTFGEAAMSLLRRQFLHLAAGAAAITTLARSAMPPKARRRPFSYQTF